MSGKLDINLYMTRKQAVIARNMFIAGIQSIRQSIAAKDQILSRKDKDDYLNQSAELDKLVKRLNIELMNITKETKIDLDTKKDQQTKTENPKKRNKKNKTKKKAV